MLVIYMREKEQILVFSLLDRTITHQKNPTRNKGYVSPVSNWSTCKGSDILKRNLQCKDKDTRIMNSQKTD